MLQLICMVTSVESCSCYSSRTCVADAFCS